MTKDRLQPGEGGSGNDYLDRARSDIVRGSLWTASATLVTMPLTFAASVIVAHALGPADLGRYATYLAVYLVVVTIVNAGWSEATVQWLASANARGTVDEAVFMVRSCSGFHVLVASPVAAATAFCLLASSGLVTAFVAAAVVYMTHAAGTSVVVLTAGARNATSAQIGLAATTATQLALITAAVASRSPAIAWAAQLCLVMLGPLLAVTALQPWERRALVRPRLTVQMPRGFLTYALSAGAAGLVAALVFGRSEIFVLRANDLVSAVGVFAVVTGLAAQLTGPLDSLLAPLTPIAAGTFAVDQERARRSFRRSLRVSAVLGTGAACVIVPVGVVMLVPLYGPRFSSGVLPFLVLGLVSCSQTVLGPVTAFAFATRGAAQVLRANILCLIVDAALAVSLIPLIGLEGAVIANATAQLTSLFAISLIVSRRLGVDLRTMMLDGRLFALGVLVGAVEGIACSSLSGAGRLITIPIVAAGVTIVWLIVRCFSGLRLAEEDLTLVARGSSHPIVRLTLAALRRADVVR